MADRYWRGGTGTWNTTNTANWSATNGGAGGASVPTINDNAFFTALSGSGTCTVSGTVECTNLYLTNFSGLGSSSVTFAGTGTVNLLFAFWVGSTGGGYTHTGTITFTGGGNSQIYSERTLTSNISVSKTAAVMSLGSAITTTGTFNVSYSGSATPREFTLNGYVLTCAAFVYGGTTNSFLFPTNSKVVVSASTAGNVLITTANGYPTNSRIEILSPPSGVTVTLVGDTSATAIDYYPNIYLIASGTGSINSQSCAGAIFDVGAGNFNVVGAGIARRTYNISSSYTGTHSGSASLGALDATGVTANFNGKTVGGLGTTTVPLTSGQGSWPININSNVTVTGGFTLSGGTVTLANSVTLTAANLEASYWQTSNDSRFIFGTGSKIVLTLTTSGTIININNNGGNFYTRTSSLGIGNNTPIEIPTPASGVTLTCSFPTGGKDTSKVKAFGIKTYSSGSGGYIQIGHSFDGNNWDVSLGALELSNDTFTLQKIPSQANVINTVGTYNGGGTNTTNQLGQLTLDGTSVQNVSGGGPNGGFGVQLNLNNGSGITLVGNLLCGSVLFGDPNIGGGVGILNLQSFTLTMDSNWSTVGTSNGININFGTGKIVFNNQRNNYAILSPISDFNWIGTITGSRLVEISPWGTLADNWPKEFQWAANDSAKFLNLKVVANGSTGKIAVGSGQPLGANLTLGAGTYTFSANAFAASADLDLYGNLSVEGSSIIYTLGNLIFGLTSVSSTIFSNGNTIGGTLQTSIGKTVNLGDAVICNRFNLYGGTLSLGSFNFTVTSFYSDSTLVRTLDFGTGSITIAQNGLWNTPNTTNYTLAGASRQLFPVVGSSAPSLTFSAASESFALDITPTIVGSGGTLALGSFARNLTIPAGTYTLNRAATYTLYGDLTVNGAITNYTGGGTALNFSKSTGTQLINTNGNVFGGTGAISVTTGATKQLAGNSSFAGNVTLTSGTLNLNSFRLQTPTFAASNSNVRTIAFGTSGAIRLTGTGTVFNTSTSTNLTVSGTNRFIEPNLNSAQTLNFGALTEANTFDVSVPSTASNFTLSFTAADNVRSLTFANVTYTVSNVNINIYGSLNILGTTPTFTAGSNIWSFLSTSGSHTIATNGKALGFPIVKTGASTLTLNDNLTVTSNSFTMNSGTLDLSTRELNVGTFNTNNANVRSIAFGTNAKIIVNTTGGSFTAQDSTNLTVTGTNRTVELRTTGGTGQVSGGLTASESALFDLVVSSSATGTAQVLRYWRNITLQNGSYSYSAPTADSRVYGNFALLGTTPTLNSGSTALTFAATSGTNTIQTSGKTIPFPFNFNGVGGTWQLSDALTVSAGLINILTNGTFNANNFSVTMGSFESNNSNVRTLQMGNATWTLSDSSTFWNITTSTNMTLTRGTGASAAIVTTGTAAKTFQGGGLTYPRLTHSSNSVLTIVGTNTRFADITRGIAAATTFTFTAGQTFLFDDWNLSGVDASTRTVVNSTGGTRHILSKSSGTVSSDFLSLTSSEATGGAGWYAGTGSLNNSNNVGWIFTAPPQASGNMLMIFM